MQIESTYDSHRGPPCSCSGFGQTEWLSVHKPRRSSHIECSGTCAADQSAARSVTLLGGLAHAQIAEYLMHVGRGTWWFRLPGLACAALSIDARLDRRHGWDRQCAGSLETRR